MRGRRTGRLLPTEAYLPGVLGQRPEPAALVDTSPEAWAADLFEAGFFWEAHEVWESVWASLARRSAPARRLQALILLSAALVKARSGRRDAALGLFDKAVAVASEGAPPPAVGLTWEALLAAGFDALEGSPAPRLGG